MAIPPIAIAPPEILCYIFALTLVSKSATPPILPAIGYGPDHCCYPGILGGPWIFGQVCSYWRKLAESTPTLWTSIILSNSLRRGSLRLVETHLAHTGNAPLDLLIRFTGGYSYPTPFNDFLPKIIAQSTRWRTLTLELHGGVFPHAEFAPLRRPGAFPWLEEIVFRGGQFEPDVDTILDCDFFKDAPALRRIALGEHVTNHWDLSLPWSQLTTFKGSLHDGEVYLGGAANLVECDFTRQYFTIYDRKILTLPHLRRLAVTDERMLRLFAAPGLEALYIHHSASGLITSLQIPGCAATLAELTLFSCVIPAEEVIAILKQLPSLTNLSLDISPRFSPDLIVAALMATERLCPKLQSLSWADREDALDRVVFADMVVSRCRKSSGVRALHFVAVYSGRRRMKEAGWRMRGIPGLDVVTMNSKKGDPALLGWRGRGSTLRGLGLPVSL
ncbi:hypothetical protein C8R47DRAFT_250570 [Mycena vitilis]|nr:hypothetical protein C8R47DRAFT_250570 [Mycena vitilis]